jgi:hypothetical protein
VLDTFLIKNFRALCPFCTSFRNSLFDVVPDKEPRGIWEPLIRMCQEPCFQFDEPILSPPDLCHAVNRSLFACKAANSVGRAVKAEANFLSGILLPFLPDCRLRDAATCSTRKHADDGGHVGVRAWIIARPNISRMNCGTSSIAATALLPRLNAHSISFSTSAAGNGIL